MAEEKKVEKKAKKDFFKWFREMRSELKKVVWPTRQVLVRNTCVSVGAMLVSAVVLWGFDELAQLLIKALFTIAG